MKNRELFLKDPLSVTLRNEGVSSNNNDDAATLDDATRDNATHDDPLPTPTTTRNVRRKR